MDNTEYKKVRKMLWIGIVFAILTVVGGEMPIGWTVYPEAENQLMGFLKGSESLSMIQLGCGVLFGGVGIPLQYYGYRAIAQILNKSGCGKCSQMIEVGAGAIAFGGGSVHILCTALLFMCRMGNMHTVTDFTVWLVLPFSLLFMLIYTPMATAMFIPVIRGETIFPRWAAIFNPLIYKGLLNAFAMLAPNVPWANGIRMSNMGIGSLITFAGILLLLSREAAKRYLVKE
jgi:hypothetical protein